MSKRHEARWFSVVRMSVAVLLAGILPVLSALPLAGSPSASTRPNELPTISWAASLEPAPQPQAQITVAVTPATYGLTISQSVTLTATVENDTSGEGVTWTVSGSSCSGSACGTLSSATSTSVKYTAPTTGGDYVITATSVANVTKSATAMIGVTDLNGMYTYRIDGTRTGINSHEFTLTPSNVNTSSFGKLFSCTLDESVYAQPLWVANVAIGGGTHNIVIVATQNDTVYAFDADSGSGTTCTQYWKASLLTSAYGAGSGATPIPPADTGETGDIPTEIGITSTPVIDPTTNYLYVVSNTKESGQYYQRLHRLILATGAETSGAPAVLSASVPGSGNGSSGGSLPYYPLHQNQRPGLALVNGIVYMASGSHGDNEPWHGWILGYNASTLAFASAYCTTPNTFGGGIWMSGSAPVFDSSNNLFVISSNGTYNGTTDFADSFLKISTTSGLTLTDWFTPDDQATLGTNNIDLGQGGAVTLMDTVSGPFPHLVIGGGKEGVLYLVNRDNMGHYNGSANTSVQSWSLGGNMIAASGTFWQNTFYIGAASSPLQAFTYNTGSGFFTTSPSSQSNVSVAFPGLTPVISAAGTANAILWAVDSSKSGTNGAATGPAVLYAFDPSNLANELWDSTQAAGNRDQAGNAVKFVVPTVANGKVYVGGVESLTVYGLLAQAPAAAAPTFSPAPGEYSAGQTVTLSDTTSGATIYYTADGTMPTTSSTVYTAPINVPSTTTIEAIAVASGLNNSAVSVGDYTIQSQTGNISFIQVNSATPQSPQTTLAIPYNSAQFAGDLNVVAVGWNDVTQTVISVTDTTGNQYVAAVGPTQNASGPLSQTIYYAKNIGAANAGANTVTVTFSGPAAYPDVRILEYSGASLTSPVDITSSASGNSTMSSSTAVTTSNANDLLFAANMNSNITTGPGTGFTTRIITPSDADIAEDRLVAATGSYTATAPINPAGAWVMQMVAFSAVSTPAPTVASVSPGSGATGGGTAVTITGTNFASGATVTFGSASATNVVVSNSTTITATTPAGTAGAATVTVTNPTGQSGSLTNGFTYVTGVTISGVSPSNGPPAGGTAVTITGTSFASGATVTFGGVAATSVVVVSATEITCLTPAGSAGAVTVTVTSGGQNGSLTNGFTYMVPPTVAGVSPNSGSTGGGTNVTVTGTNFAAGATVTFGAGRQGGDGNANATNVVVVSATQITCTTPAGNAGAVNVAVTVNGETGTLTNGFTYVAVPTVTSVSPGNGPAAGGTAVTITGTNFATGATVTFGSAAATNVVVVSSTSITATTPAGSAGAVTVTVTVGGQSGSLSSGFTYVVAPTVTGVSPSSGSTLGGTAVTITGTNFATGATVTFGSAAATNVVVVSSTSITATTPAGSVGVVTVTVTNPGSLSGSLASGFTYVVAPTVTGVSPNNGPTGGGTAATITGTNFASGATVTFGGTAATNVVVVSGTSITATTPAHASGPVTVAVTSNGQSGNLSSGYTYNAAAVLSFVQGNYATPQTASSSVSVTYTAAQGAGDLNVVVVGWNDSTNTVSSVTDTKGNVYTPAVGPTTISGVESQSIYYAKNIAAATAGANVVNVTYSGAAAYPDIRILEYAGVDPNTPIDVVSASTGDSTTSASAAVTTTNANDLLVGGNIVQTHTTAAGSGYASRMITSPDGDIVEDRIVTATGSYSASATLNPAAQWIMQMVAFRSAGSGGGDTTPPTAPSNLTATPISASQINLAWTASTDNVGVTGYYVQRCAGAGCTNFAQVASVSGTATTYNDTGLAASTSYSYRVDATDAAGNLSAFSNTATATTSTATGTPGLVAAYDFNAGSGTTVSDVSGNGNTGTIVNATWTTSGKYGGALSFNGTNAQVTIPDSASLHLTTAVTLEAWVSPSSAPTGWQDVIYKPLDNYFLEAASSNGNKPGTGVLLTSSAEPVVYGSAQLAGSTWTHLAMTYDGTTLKIYVNGTLVSSATQSGTITTSTDALQIGGDTTYGQYFKGVIDEVRVYNIALTQAQIQSDMATALP
jgi:Concanavalin A-like lectin/glucanases superfamily/Chitobiase/beta-hexosaminidase C-terminal domain/IPT/TIG domain/Fibronectin type III domain